MKLAILLLFSSVSFAQVVNPGGGGGGAPSGPAGGDLSGTYPNPTVTTSHIAAGAAAFTDKVSVTSTTASTTTSTLQVNDTEAATLNTFPMRILSPNMANNNIANYILGNAESTNNAFIFTYTRLAAGGGTNRFSIQPYSQPLAFSIFAGTGNVVIGSSTTDAGFKLDTTTARASTKFTSPIHSTGTTSNTDTAGKLVVSTGSTTSAVLTFTGTYATAMPCVIDPQNITPTAATTLGGYVPQVTTTQLSITVGSAPAADTTFAYHCFANN